MNIKCKLKLTEYTQWYRETCGQESIYNDTDQFVIDDMDDDTNEYHVLCDFGSVWLPKKFVEIVND